MTEELVFITCDSDVLGSLIYSCNYNSNNGKLPIVYVEAKADKI